MKKNPNIELFNLAMEAKDYYTASGALQQYFEDDIVVATSYFPDFLLLRNKLPKKHQFDINESEKYIKFAGKNTSNIYDLIPEKLKVKSRKIPNSSNWKPEKDDKPLMKIISSFTHKSTSRLDMIGVHFGKNEIVATDAHSLIYLPAKTKEQGVFCMTRNCFKNNNEKSMVDWKFPDFKNILPEIKNQFSSFTLPIQELRDLIKTIQVFYGKKTRLHFRYDSDSHISFHTGVLLKAIEAFAMLGETEVRLWLEYPSKQAIITAPDNSAKNLNNQSQPFILVMPLLTLDKGQEDFKEFEKVYVGDFRINLNTSQLETQGIWQQPAKSIILKNTKDSDMKTQRAIAYVFAQKQRIRILKLAAA